MPDNPGGAPSRKQLRRELRRRRRALSPRERNALAHDLSRRVLAHRLFLSADRIACYLANDGEMDLAPLMSRMWSMGKRPYLPILHGPKLWFLPLTPETRLADNRFGIAEPDGDASARCPVNALNLVLMPLVGFDSKGNRLGMGGGFYDRTFAYLRHRNNWKKPDLIGVAYEFQRLEQLQAQAWDVPLSGVATERGLRLFNR